VPTGTGQPGPVEPEVIGGTVESTDSSAATIPGDSASNSVAAQRWVSSSDRVPPAASSVPVIQVAASSAAAPVMTASPSPVVSAGSVSGMGGGLLSWLDSGTTGDVPVAAPLMWTALAVTRRELGRTMVNPGPAASTSTGELLSGSGLTVNSPSAASAGAFGAGPIGDFDPSLRPRGISRWTARAI
jgi:hypothetical protein